MDWIKRSGSWVWTNLGNLTWFAGLLASFALPAWAVRVTGIMAEWAPASWVAAGFAGMAIAVPLFALFAWAKGRLVRARYDARLLAQGGEIDPLAKTFERKRIFLNEFVLPSLPYVEGKTFIDCEIVGPANLILRSGNSVTAQKLPYCDGYVLSDFNLPNNGYVFDNCVFRGCSFNRVSLMLTLPEYALSRGTDWIIWRGFRPTDEALEQAVAALTTPPPASPPPVLTPPLAAEPEAKGFLRWLKKKK